MSRQPGRLLLAVVALLRAADVAADDSPARVRPLSTAVSLSHGQLGEVLPEYHGFSNREELDHNCRTAYFPGAEGGSGMGLEDLREFVVGFYASGADIIAEAPVLQGVLGYRRRVAAVCPLAVMQALLVKIEALLFGVYTSSGLARNEHLSAFNQASALHTEFGVLEHWAAHHLGGEVPHLGWPIKEGWRRALRFYDILWKDVHDSEDTWAIMEQPGQISDELFHAAFKQVAAVLTALGLEWWPCRGTLIAFLRHGRRAGRLSRGIVDVVERDIDIMLGVADEVTWWTLSKEIERRLMAEGWDRCWTKTSAENGSPLRDAARRDLLYCVRMKPAYMLVDISSYINGAPGDDVFVHRTCGGKAIDGTEGNRFAAEGCVVPEGVGPLRHNRGLLAKDVILPLKRCRANGMSIPCPHRPLESITAMIHSGLDVSCIALPTTKGRDQDEPDTIRLEQEGLCSEDVRILLERSARLHALGFQSMLPYFDGCEGIAELRARSCA